MHELSLAQDMVTTLVRVAAEHHAARVAKVRLRLGELTHVDAETLGFAFGVCCRGTVLEGCRLEIARQPARVGCPACGWAGPRAPAEHRCPSCDHLGFTVLAGRELELDSIDVDD